MPAIWWLAGFAFIYMMDKRDGDDAIKDLDRYVTSWAWVV
jgi:hypothetical protein